MRRAAFTLVEVLVALALTGLLGSLLLAASSGGARAGTRVALEVHQAERAALAEALLRWELEAAGRGRADGGLEVRFGAAGARGDVLRIRYLREAWREAPKEVDVELFAALDSAGRPNLYRRAAGSVRQPLVLGVTGLEVVGGLDAGGGALAREELAARRVHALHLRLRHADDRTTRVVAVPRYLGPVAVTEGTP